MTKSPQTPNATEKITESVYIKRIESATEIVVQVLRGVTPDITSPTLTKGLYEKAVSFLSREFGSR